MAEATGPDERILVVPDVNVYLDVARLTGEPFTWDAFDNLVTLHTNESNPHPSNGNVDSLRAVATLRGPRSPLGIRREVWTSEHINETVAFKAHQSTDATDRRDRGLGWSIAGAQGLIDELIWGLVEISDGDIAAHVNAPYGCPPLDREDGMVFATARDAGFMDAGYYQRFVITRDRGFQDAQLPGETQVIPPANWVDLHRGESRAIALKRLLGYAPPTESPQSHTNQ